MTALWSDLSFESIPVKGNGGARTPLGDDCGYETERCRGGGFGHLWRGGGQSSLEAVVQSRGTEGPSFIPAQAINKTK